MWTKIFVSDRPVKCASHLVKLMHIRSSYATMWESPDPEDFSFCVGPDGRDLKVVQCTQWTPNLGEECDLYSNHTVGGAKVSLKKTLLRESFLISVHASMKRRVYLFAPFADKAEPKVLLICCEQTDLFIYQRNGSREPHWILLWLFAPFIPYIQNKQFQNTILTHLILCAEAEKVTSNVFDFSSRFVEEQMLS